MKKSPIIFILLIIAITLVIGIFIGRHFSHATTQKKPLYWIDTMEPTIHYSKPGKSRMNMDLVPVYPDENEFSDQSSVRISPAVVNNLGVREAPVLQGELSRRIETVAYVEPNENKISHIHTYADGWVKKMFVKAVGDVVKRNQVVLQLYSPTLVNVQEEYLIALDSKNKSLIDASLKRLQAFHISENQIQQLKTTRKVSHLIDIDPHEAGVVTMLNVREGMHVTPETEMMSIVDLSSIWMIAHVYEDQANLIKVGEKAEAKLPAFPGKVWTGKIEYIYPEVESSTRTVKVRFRFDNPDGFLKPNMYANISLLSAPKLNVLSIPIEALIRSSQGDHVIVSLSNGRFQSRSVIVGMTSGDQIEVISGLKAGEIVVISGQFLIDSESNLKTGMQRLDTSTDATAATPPQKQTNNDIVSNGVITGIDISKHTITLQHEAIAALNWPAMTMDFSADNAIELNQFKVGDHVTFTLMKSQDNTFMITTLKKLSP